MTSLSALAARALACIKTTHTSVGHMVFRSQFDPEVQAAFVPLMDELTKAGYLTRTVYLVDRSRRGTWGDDYEHVSLSDEEAAEAIECQRNKTMFVNPDTGDERVPGPEDLFISYCTTDKVPVLPPPPDERAVALHARLLGKVPYLREEARRHRNTVSHGHPQEYDAGIAEGQALAFAEAANLLAEAFGIRPPFAPEPPAP